MNLCSASPSELDLSMLTEEQSYWSRPLDVDPQWEAPSPDPFLYLQANRLAVRAPHPRPTCYLVAQIF